MLQKDGLLFSGCCVGFCVCISLLLSLVLFFFFSCRVQSLRISFGEQATSLLHQALRIRRSKRYALKVT